MNKLIGGKKSFVKCLDEGYLSNAINPTLYYFYDTGFEVASGLHKRSDIVFLMLLYYRASDGKRNLKSSDYNEIREEILEKLEVNE